MEEGRDEGEPRLCIGGVIRQAGLTNAANAEMMLAIISPPALTGNAAG